MRGIQVTKISGKRLIAPGMIGILLVGTVSWLSFQTMGTADDRQYMVRLVNRNPQRAVELLEEKKIDPYSYGSRLLMEGEKELALEWYQGLVNFYKDPKYLFGRARALWRGGNKKAAIRDCEYILTLDNSEPIVLARTHYLLGSIAHHSGNMGKSESEFLESLVIYQDLGKAGGQYLCLIELAQLYADQRNFDTAIATLDEALAANEALEERGFPAYSKGRYYEISGNILYAQGDFNGALGEYIKSETDYRIDKETVQAEQVLAKIGLLHYMTGTPSKANAISNELWTKYHNDPKNARLMAYNNVTLMLLDRCSQEEAAAEARKKAALEWSQESSDGDRLRQLIQYLETYFPCPEWR